MLSESKCLCVSVCIHVYVCTRLIHMCVFGGPMCVGECGCVCVQIICVDGFAVNE